jgi:hypothetical protein
MNRVAEFSNPAVDFDSECVRIFSDLRPNATYLAVHQYTNNYGELSNFSIVFHINYRNALIRSKKLLEDFKPNMAHVLGRVFSLQELREAKDDLLSSIDDSLAGINPRATSAHAYSPILALASGEEWYGESQSDPEYAVKGIKLHRRQDIVHLYGFLVHKVVLMNGNYPIVKSKPFTVARNYLRNMLPVGAFRQFKLTRGKFDRLTVEKVSVREEDVVRNYLNTLTPKAAGE